jgi:uncharacterized membrane protein (DUF441 family)
MELHDALTQITEIRAQMARTEVFRGYRAGPVAASGLLAFTAGTVQAVFIRDPQGHINAYLALWTVAAVLSAVLAGLGMAARRRKMLSSAWSREITWLAIEQFIPCLVAGTVVTAALVSCVPEGVHLLPGLWQILFGLGIFSSCRLLPRATALVAGFYLVAGAVSLILARGDAAFSPWAMALPFGVGQLLAAGVLYWTLERRHGQAY